MGRLLGSCSLILALAPAAALAQQPGAGAPPPPPDPYPQQQPAPPPPGSYPQQQQPAPPPPGSYPQQQQPAPPPPNPYPPGQYPPGQPYPQQYPSQQYPQQYPPQQYPQPYPPQPPAQSVRNGMTFEAGLGVGYLNSEGDDSEGGLALGLGVGTWLSPKAVVSGRLHAITLSDDNRSVGGVDARLTHYFIGASVQYWATENLWLGGGAGLAALRLSADGYDESISGFGLEVRSGYTFNATTENTFNVSLELTPSFFEENGNSATITGIAVLVGYQHL